MREVDMHEREVSSTREASLGFVPMTLVSRLFAGAPFAAGWTAAVVVPLVRAVESDVPMGILLGATALATIAPVILYLRRHAMNVRLRWDADTLTLLRGGRVATSIAWSDAIVRQRSQRSGLDRTRVVQVSDRSGRVITLATGSLAGLVAPLGRARIASRDLDALVRTAETRATFVAEPPKAEPGRRAATILRLWLLGCLAVALFATGPSTVVEPIAARGAGGAMIAAFAFACACVALLIDPARRILAAFARPLGRETLVIDTEERGRVRARRLDGSRVLLDVAAASHPDAMLSSRRGFVNAVLVVPTDGSGTPYRSLEAPIPATFVETRDDRVLRFEHLRAALVDVIGYGAFFASAVAAVCVA